MLPLAVLLLAPQADPPALAVQLKTPAAGDRYRSSHQSKLTATTSMATAGVPVDTPPTRPTAETREFADEVLEWPATGVGPVSVRRTFSRDEAEWPARPEEGLSGRRFTLLADGPGQTTKVTPHDGRPAPDLVVLERLGTTLDVAHRVRLGPHLPTKPVAVGGTWAPDLRTVAKGLTHDRFRWDARTSSATGKLVNRNRRDGFEYGRIEVAVDIVLTKQVAGVGGRPADDAKPANDEKPLRAGSRMTLRLVIEGCLDGSRYDLTVTERLTTELRPDTGVAGYEVGSRTVREATDRLEPVR